MGTSLFSDFSGMGNGKGGGGWTRFLFNVMYVRIHVFVSMYVQVHTINNT